MALQAYIDGPNYVTDPIVFAVDDVLPQAGRRRSETRSGMDMNDSEIITVSAAMFCWRREMPSVTSSPAISASTRIDGNAAAHRRLLRTNQVAGSTNLGKFTPGSTKAVTGANSSSARPVSAAVKAVGNEVQAAADRFQRRVEKLKSAVEKKKADATATND